MIDLDRWYATLLTSTPSLCIDRMDRNGDGHLSYSELRAMLQSDAFDCAYEDVEEALLRDRQALSSSLIWASYYNWLFETKSIWQYAHRCWRTWTRIKMATWTSKKWSGQSWRTAIRSVWVCADVTPSSLDVTRKKRPWMHSAPQEACTRHVTMFQSGQQMYALIPPCVKIPAWSCVMLHLCSIFTGYVYTHGHIYIYISIYTYIYIYTYMCMRMCMCVCVCVCVCVFFNCCSCCSPPAFLVLLLSCRTFHFSICHSVTRTKAFHSTSICHKDKQLGGLLQEKSGLHTTYRLSSVCEGYGEINIITLYTCFFSGTCGSVVQFATQIWVA